MACTLRGKREIRNSPPATERQWPGRPELNLKCLYYRGAYRAGKSSLPPNLDIPTAVKRRGGAFFG